MSWEVDKALAEISGRHAAKKRATVIRLADAIGKDQPMAEVFALPDTCSATTWYGRYRQGKRRPGWVDDAVIQKALKAATERAHYFTDNYIIEQIQETQRRLARWGPPAADNLGVLMRQGSPSDMRRATEAVLDRMATETASKATVPSPGGDIMIPIREVVVELPKDEPVEDSG